LIHKIHFDCGKCTKMCLKMQFTHYFEKNEKN
jgi:hypothetical protein